MVYAIIPLTGKPIEFHADEMEEMDGYLRFYVEGCLMGEFKKDNVAGYFVSEEEDDEEAD